MTKRLRGCATDAVGCLGCLTVFMGYSGAVIAVMISEELRRVVYNLRGIKYEEKAIQAS